ncbi:hypothetical protein J437_LFUL018526 [Ladona fulva]|uniref:Reverse transcriptase domain-containing protein n=1 Tax=Ladona fulva TaxID=123851 RepID=A0A8K0P1S2_LADFU|nr:hypothetical protein J437_LFUL018526 [Ladona fulva]
MVMINDLSSNISTNLTMYADDVTFLHSYSDQTQTVNFMNNILNQAHEWFRVNGLLMNLEKIKQLACNLSAQSTDYVKLLGIKADSKLQWDRNIEFLGGKHSKCLYILRKLRLFIPQDHLITAYYSLFYYHLSYVIKIISGIKPYESCRSSFSNLKIMTIHSLYVLVNFVCAKEHFCNLALRSNVHSFNTRCKNNLDMPQCRLSISLNNLKCEDPSTIQ